MSARSIVDHVLVLDYTRGRWNGGHPADCICEHCDAKAPARVHPKRLAPLFRCASCGQLIERGLEETVAGKRFHATCGAKR